MYSEWESSLVGLPTDHHEGELEAFLHRLAVDLVREVCEAHVTRGLGKLEDNGEKVFQPQISLAFISNIKG